MNQTIQDFYARATKSGFSRDFQLRVTSFNINGASLFLDEDLVFIKTATLPGKTISVQTAPFMGLTFNVPGAVSYAGSGNWPIKFYADQSLDIRQILENAMTRTFGVETSSGNIFPRDLTSNSITLSLFDDQLTELRSYQLQGVFITDLGAISYNATGSGAIVEIEASIAYQYWVDSKMGVAGARGGIGGIANNIGGVLGNIGTTAATAAGVINRASSAIKSIGNIFGRR